MSALEKDLEIIALRSQLAVVQQKIINRKMKKPHLTTAFRQLWVLLSKWFPAWKSSLILVKPETVIAWHRRSFKSYWRRKAKSGRPKISNATIALIKRIHKENPTLSPEKIHERLISLHIADAPAPNTILKYIKVKRIPPTEGQRQSWQTFLKNHVTGIWAMDFALVPSLLFKPLYILLIVSHDRRKIEHFAVTEHPTAEWTRKQLRNATPFGKQPNYLIHDNDTIFRAGRVQQFLSLAGIKSKRTAHRSPWQNGICERLIGTMRRELLDHIIPLNQRHLERLLAEYVNYYNNTRTHQFLDGETPIKSLPPPKTTMANTILSATPILGGLYHSYDKAA